MDLLVDNTRFKNSLKVSDYLSQIKSLTTIRQEKISLNHITTWLELTFDPDMITFDDSFAYRAKMPCGHTISTESMVHLMLSVAQSKKDYKICCPAIKKGTLNQKCNTEW